MKIMRCKVTQLYKIRAEWDECGVLSPAPKLQSKIKLHRCMGPPRLSAYWEILEGESSNECWIDSSLEGSL